MAFTALSLSLLALVVVVLLPPAIFGGGLLGRSVGAAVESIPGLRKAWELGVPPGDAWGTLVGALTGLGMVLLGAGLASAYLLP